MRNVPPILILVLHLLDGREIVINPRAIVSITKPGDALTESAGCVVSLVDGKFVSTVETCKEIVLMLKEEGN